MAQDAKRRKLNPCPLNEFGADSLPQYDASLNAANTSINTSLVNTSNAEAVDINLHPPMLNATPSFNNLPPNNFPPVDDNEQQSDGDARLRRVQYHLPPVVRNNEQVDNLRPSADTSAGAESVGATTTPPPPPLALEAPELEENEQFWFEKVLAHCHFKERDKKACTCQTGPCLSAGGPTKFKRIAEVSGQFVLIPRRSTRQSMGYFMCLVCNSESACKSSMSNLLNHAKNQNHFMNMANYGLSQNALKYKQKKDSDGDWQAWLASCGLQKKNDRLSATISRRAIKDTNSNANISSSAPMPSVGSRLTRPLSTAPALETGPPSSSFAPQTVSGIPPIAPALLNFLTGLTSPNHRA